MYLCIYVTMGQLAIMVFDHSRLSRRKSSLQITAVVVVIIIRHHQRDASDQKPESVPLELFL